MYLWFENDYSTKLPQAANRLALSTGV